MLREYVRTHALRATYVRTYMRIATCYILGGAALRMHTRYVRTTYARTYVVRAGCGATCRSEVTTCYALACVTYVRTTYVRTHMLNATCYVHTEGRL